MKPQTGTEHLQVFLLKNMFPGLNLVISFHLPNKYLVPFLLRYEGQEGNWEQSLWIYEEEIIPS